MRSDFIYSSYIQFVVCFFSFPFDWVHLRRGRLPFWFPGTRVLYVGVDVSKAVVAEARRCLSGVAGVYKMLRADVSADDVLCSAPAVTSPRISYSMDALLPAKALREFCCASSGGRMFL